MKICHLEFELCNNEVAVLQSDHYTVASTKIINETMSMI